MSHLIIGTAGHIDHGKTQLVKALTGIDTDRLKEEIKRGITIDLGFAHLDLPSGKQVSLIDVPGHEKFIKNMLAGVAGIDLALLVVAADEGIMPQTREHFDILKLLEIRDIIVVITKIDLVEEEFLELVSEEIQEFLRDSPYEEASVQRVSALTGEGMEKLIRTIDQETAHLDKDITKEIARIPLDRIFTLQGFGTVVTGTIFNGDIFQGEVLEEPIKGIKVRIRNIQVHNNSVEKVGKGQRAALNIAGSEAAHMKRGDVLCQPGWLIPTDRLDLSCYLLESSPWPIKDQTRIRFYQGTRETLGRVYLLDKDTINPGEKGYLQIHLEEPVVSLRGDNFIIRSYSPLHTIGGGKIINPLARKHKKNQKGLLDSLRIMEAGDSEALTRLFASQRQMTWTGGDLARFLGMPQVMCREITNNLWLQGVLVKIPIGEREEVFVSSKTMDDWEDRVSREIKEYSSLMPLEPGLNKETLRAKLWPNMPVKEFNALLQYWLRSETNLILEGQYLTLKDLKPQRPVLLEKKVAAVEEYFLKNGLQVSTWDKIRDELEIDEKTGKQILQYLLRIGNLIPLGSQLYLEKQVFNGAQKTIVEKLEGGNSLTVAEARDLLGTTRKITVPLLEYLDKGGVTSRRGDTRLLAQGG